VEDVKKHRIEKIEKPKREDVTIEVVVE